MLGEVRPDDETCADLDFWSPSTDYVVDGECALALGAGALAVGTGSGWIAALTVVVSGGSIALGCEELNPF